MNLAFFSRFSRTRKSNAVFKLMNHVKKHPVFRLARMDIYISSLRPKRLIILLGQVHTVWRGKISDRERRKIVACQARLCSYYAYFKKFYGVTQFGGEGIYEGLALSFRDKKSFRLYRKIQKTLRFDDNIPIDQMASVARRVFQILGKKWQMALRKQAGQNEKLRQYASAVSGQTLFNYLNGGSIRVYPIEEEKAYHQVLVGINRLGDQVAALEQTYEMKVVRQRGGVVKNIDEAQVVKQYNMLVKEFNTLIGSDIRERATLEILLQKAKEEFPLVFTMGIGHRKNYRLLLQSFFKSNETAFLFITPPELLINLWWLIGLPLFFLVVLVLVGLFF